MIGFSNLKSEKYFSGRRCMFSMWEPSKKLPRKDGAYFVIMNPHEADLESVRKGVVYWNNGHFYAHGEAVDKDILFWYEQET